MATPANVSDYMAPETFARIKSCAKGKETPFLVVDLTTVSEAYDELAHNFPQAKIFFAVKANPAVEVAQLLADKGSNFDLASRHELDRILTLGIDPIRLSFGNTIKKPQDIRYFFDAGVRLFATDSECDLRNIAKAAPGAKVFVRILPEGSLSADWPLSRKFGCHPDMAMDLLILARQLGLIPYGVSFHVGSQQRDIAAWDGAISKVRHMFERLKQEDGIELKMINIGGGLPGNYISKTHTVATYAKEILRFLTENFGDDLPDVIVEPGRSLVANSGVLVSEVVLVARKSRYAIDRWVYCDVGKFSGLIETLGESIKFPVYVDKKGEVEEVILAGPTCDSMDIMYEDFKYSLPLNLAQGDRIYWFTTGAYTASYSSVEFNGFPPLKTYFIEK